MAASQLIADIKQYLPFFTASGGGVTASGGEPLLQAEFLLTLFKKLQQLGIHTAVDTSGYVNVEKIKELLACVDLVMLSIKHADPEKYPAICGGKSDRPRALVRCLNKINKPVWLRYVVIPGITDDQQELKQLKDWVKTMPNIEKLELLPYHTMGVYKWERLCLPYTMPLTAANGNGPYVSIPPSADQ